MRYRAPTPLTTTHVIDDFSCASTEQTDWLRRFSRPSTSIGTTRVFVVNPVSDQTVVAYYAWCMAQLSIDQVPSRLRKGAGRYPQPLALLARLGVDVRHESHGLGAGVLRDVITRTAALSDEIGCRGLAVHAESESARDFYLHLIPEFEPSPTDDLHLILLLKDIKRTLHLDRR